MKCRPIKIENEKISATSELFPQGVQAKFQLKNIQREANRKEN